MSKKTITEEKCVRCKHRWFPNKPGQVRVCPKCHMNPYTKPQRKSAARPNSGRRPYKTAS